ncbi:Endonuclease/exonuclease/phosphatase [Mortierella sp. GBAus27b]|nr:Glucose-repressible alcohol dehydrogenase transcriptional effector [Mortierella sp. GBA43]KAI8357051.1 Endonuclease/exonuclease/phosphatase [Mortierella sp. GBAus27b]
MLSSVIPRGWLYEDDFVPSLADDVLIALPKREWVYDSSGSVAMDPKSFVVMSWNVLSPRLCHASRLDPGCEPAFLDWNYRKQAILNQIAFMDADIVCLQELELDDYEGYFNPQLTRLGFKSIHAYKTTVYEMRDGCAIFYRESRFKLLHEHVLRFNQVELDDHNTGRPSLARDTAIRFNLFHNLAIVALFENRKTKRQVQVATTHLLADPAFPDAKMLQTAILTSKLEELKAEAIEAATAAAATAAASPQQPRPASAVPPQHIPTILAGDFNSLPDSSVVSFLKTGQVETRHFGGNDFGRFTRAESKYFHHGLGLSDSYESSILPFTNATRKFQGTIDYMLYDPSALGLVGFLDHLEADPMWSQAATASPSSSSSTTTTTSTRSRTHANMSSSDLDSELEIDSISSPPSSVTSCTPSSIDSTATRRKNKASKRAKKVSIRDLSLLLTSQASIQSQDGSKKKTAMAKTESDQELEHDPRVVVRADIPTALPGQHFPSDHLPLVAIFREREHVQTATPKVE